MNCPRLPSVPSGIISKIDPSWFRTLNECLAFAMTHPRGDGKTIFQDAGGSLRAASGSGDGGVSGSAAGYANYFAVESTGWNANGAVTGVRIFDGGNPESPYAGLTDVDTVSAGTLAGPFANNTYICLRLGVQTGTSGNYYTHTFEAMGLLPNAWEPVVILAQIVGGNVVQRWTGGMIFWRSRFVIGFGREYTL